MKVVKSIAEHKLADIEKATLIHVHEKTTMDLLMRYAAKEQIDREISIEKDRLDEICASLSELGIKKVNVIMVIQTEIKTDTGNHIIVNVVNNDSVKYTIAS